MQEDPEYLARCRDNGNRSEGGAALAPLLSLSRRRRRGSDVLDLVSPFTAPFELQELKLTSSVLPTCRRCPARCRPRPRAVYARDIRLDGRFRLRLARAQTEGPTCDISWRVGEPLQRFKLPYHRSASQTWTGDRRLQCTHSIPRTFLCNHPTAGLVRGVSALLMGSAISLAGSVSPNARLRFPLGLLEYPGRACFSVLHAHHCRVAADAGARFPVISTRGCWSRCIPPPPWRLHFAALLTSVRLSRPRSCCLLRSELLVKNRCKERRARHSGRVSVLALAARHILLFTESARRIRCVCAPKGRRGEHYLPANRLHVVCAAPQSSSCIPVQVPATGFRRNFLRCKLSVRRA
ncbi:hypothetical protein DFH06DRAFT_755453 [Mycena polygramma]|nr:hypothetical protein DFH06DRAFT_755453 [Mycena polygramma]